MADDAIDPRVLIKEPAAREICGGISAPTWFRLETGRKPSAGTFPRQVRLPSLPNKKFYVLAEVRAWLEAQIDAATVK